jgi:4-phosphopantoate--beta-alanine ligase
MPVMKEIDRRFLRERPFDGVKIGMALHTEAKTGVLAITLANGGAKIRLAKEIPAKIEVNIFHRTKERMELLIDHMEKEGAEGVLGRDPDARIPGLSSDRALCTKIGIYDSDVILVPIEDGDRAKALAEMGKAVISIDLNPLSRTSKTATVSISDEMTRALENMIAFVKEMKGRHDVIEETIKAFSNNSNRKEIVEEICSSLRSEFKGGVE